MKTNKNNLSKILKGTALSAGLTLMPINDANSAIIEFNSIYNNNSVSNFGFAWQAPSGVKSFEYKTGINFSDLSSIVGGSNGMGPYDVPINSNNNGEVDILNNAGVGNYNVSGLTSFYFNPTVFGFSNTTTAQDILNQYGTVQRDVIFNLVNGGTYVDRLNLPNFERRPQFDSNPSSVPEPNSALLFGSGLAGFSNRKKQNKNNNKN